MDEMTAQQMLDARDTTEKAAATILGQMLFDFARLDVALGLCLVWSNGGQQMEPLTRKVAELNFSKKLDLMSDLVERSFTPGSKKHIRYSQWMDSAHKLRLTRNELVHGRWGVDAYGQHVINIIGLPTSPEQRETPYSIQDLELILGEMKRLQTELHQLRDQWPL